MVADPSWPIIVGGSHRSGTSLLRRLLNGHPRIFCPAEIKFFKDLLGQFPNDPLAHGRLGSSIAALGLPQQVWIDEFGRALVRCYELAAAKNGKPRWADKNPENAINVAHWDRLLSGKMYFVIVVRHPFDILASMAEIRMDKVIPIDVRGRAVHIRKYYESAFAFIEGQHHRSIVLRYEQLVHEPIETLSSLMRLLGDEFRPEMLDLLGSKNHGGGLEDPKVAAGGSVRSASVGRWRRDLTSLEIEQVTGTLGSLMQHLGYHVD
jgi:Sulfotransferase family